MTTILETERLSLREQTEGDAPFILELLNDPGFLENIGDRGVRTVEQARDYILQGAVASYREHGFGLYLVERKEDGAPTGVCGLVKRDHLDFPDLAFPDLGFAFLPAFRGLGYATESGAAVMDQAREVLDLGRLVAIVAQHNHGSIRVLEKLGFVLERPLRLKGEDEEILLYVSLPGDS